MKKIIIGIIISFFVFINFTNAYTQSEIDAANFLAEKNIINNHTQNPENYKLDDFVLRQEIAAVSRGLVGLEKKEKCDNIFNDVSNNKPNSWICYTVEALEESNIIASNKNFNPEKNITKAESIGMIVKALGLNFSLGKAKTWEEQIVEFAVKRGIVKKFTDYNSFATRGFVFEVAKKAMSNNYLYKKLSNIEKHFKGDVTKYKKELYFEYGTTKKNYKRNYLELEKVIGLEKDKLKNILDNNKKYFFQKVYIEGNFLFIYLINNLNEHILLIMDNNGNIKKFDGFYSIGYNQKRKYYLLDKNNKDNTFILHINKKSLVLDSVKNLKWLGTELFLVDPLVIFHEQRHGMIGNDKIYDLLENKIIKLTKKINLEVSGKFKNVFYFTGNLTSRSGYYFYKINKDNKFLAKIQEIYYDKKNNKILFGKEIEGFFIDEKFYKMESLYYDYLDFLEDYYKLIEKQDLEKAFIYRYLLTAKNPLTKDYEEKYKKNFERFKKDYSFSGQINFKVEGLRKVSEDSKEGSITVSYRLKTYYGNSAEYNIINLKIFNKKIFNNEKVVNYKQGDYEIKNNIIYLDNFKIGVIKNKRVYIKIGNKKNINGDFFYYSFELNDYDDIYNGKLDINVVGAFSYNDLLFYGDNFHKKINFKCDGPINKGTPYLYCKTNNKDYLEQYEFRPTLIMFTGGEPNVQWKKTYIKKVGDYIFFFDGKGIGKSIMTMDKNNKEYKELSTKKYFDGLKNTHWEKEKEWKRIVNSIEVGYRSFEGF